MIHVLTRRLLVILAILALVIISTAAAAHGHVRTKSDESQCPLCIAVHRAKHVVAAVGVALCFTPVQTAFLVPRTNSAIPFIEPTLTKDRAPPQA